MTTCNGPRLNLNNEDLTVLTDEDLMAVGPTTTIPPDLILHEDPTAVGPTTTILSNPILYDQTQPQQLMDRSTTKDQTTLEQMTTVDHSPIDC